MNTTQQDAGSFQDTHSQPQVREAMQSQTAIGGIRDPRRKSPFLASVLSVLPGLGQVYVGYYRRGFYNILIFGSIFSIVVATNKSLPFSPLLVLFLLFFEFYNIIDAGRRATLFNLSLEGIKQIDLPDELTNQPMAIGGSYVFGLLLLGFGMIALSRTLFGISLEWVRDWWPMLPIAFGGYLVAMAYLDSKETPEKTDEAE